MYIASSLNDSESAYVCKERYMYTDYDQTKIAATSSKLYCESVHCEFVQKLRATDQWLMSTLNDQNAKQTEIVNYNIVNT